VRQPLAEFAWYREAVARSGAGEAKRAGFRVLRAQRVSALPARMGTRLAFPEAHALRDMGYDTRLK